MAEEKSKEKEKKSDDVRVELDLPKDRVKIEGLEEQIEARAEEKAKEAIVKKAEEIEEEKDKQERREKKKQEKEKKKEEEESGFGYEAKEVLKAVAEPPEPKSKGAPNKNQKILLLIGFAMIILSIIVWPLFSFLVALGIAVAAAILIAVGTLVKV